MPEPFAERCPEYRRRIAECLDRALPAADASPEGLHEAMRYAALSGGKRVRPLLVYAAGECLSVDASLLDAPATAIELIHAFSLVHDDLPAMDDDDLRRGEPTVHRKFDEATAILAADALQPLAFEVLAAAPGVENGQALALVRLLARAAGSLGMTGGQSIDLASEGRRMAPDELGQMHALKTGALIRASVLSACILRRDLPEDRRDRLDRFAEAIGLAFQITDDVLDVEGETGTIGKHAGRDQRLRKATWPSVFGLRASRDRCRTLLDEALGLLDAFGTEAEALRWLSRYIVERKQ
ncbi:MAG TPA: farnesyl diphosphate synthase [Woeseiaceae bacterium]|nr:farnesyl diphosphate synthase [Woeseiaceae bacterium]